MPESNLEERASHIAQAEPIVSVVIPAYNSSRFIADAVKSVLDQTFSSFELIVVNDGSSDTDELETAMLPYLPRLRYFSQENRGPSAARNLGIRNARGRYVAFLDSDDVWLPHHLADQIRHLENNEGLGLVYSNNSQVDEQGYTSNAFARVPQSLPVTREALLALRCVVNTSSVVVLREALVRVGLFDEEMRRCEDFDLWLRLASMGTEMTFDRGVQVVHRRTRGLSSDQDLMKRARKAVYRKALATLALTPEEANLAAEKIRELDKKIEIEAAKRHLSAGTYDEALAAIERAKSYGPDRRLSLAGSALRYCPSLFRWCYGHYVQALHSYKRRANWEKQGGEVLNSEAVTRSQVLDR
jgi:glycosyltransferase involved in cell wall biosynthesis